MLRGVSLTIKAPWPGSEELRGTVLILNSGTKASIEVAKWETEPLRGEQSKAPWLEGSHCHAQGRLLKKL